MMMKEVESRKKETLLDLTTRVENISCSRAFWKKYYSQKGIFRSRDGQIGILEENSELKEKYSIQRA